MPDSIQTQLPQDRYWAAEGDPKKLVGYCRQQIRNFQDALEGSSYLRRVVRSLRYYHGDFHKGGETLDMALRQLGDQGEMVGISVNELRSQAQGLLTLATDNRPTWDTRARNSDQESLDQARKGNQLLDYYYETEGLEEVLIRSAEHALILCQGFVYTFWDTHAGRNMAADGEFYIRAGDIRFENPTLFDLAWDTSLRDWKKMQWILVRQYVNRWDLLARYPEAPPVDPGMMDAGILEMDPFEEVQQEDPNAAIRKAILAHSEDSEDEEMAPEKDHRSSDLVSVWNFHHLDTDGLPGGRCMQFLGETHLPQDDESDFYGFIPVDRTIPGETLMTSFGYSSILDLQPINEAINGCKSIALSNLRTFGIQQLYMPTGTNVAPADVEGFTIYTGDEPPIGIQLTSNARDAYELPNQFRIDGQLMTGVNDVARGQSQKGDSGSALALIDAKAVQAASPLKRSYRATCAAVGTKALKLTRMLSGERVVSITGKHNQTATITVGPDSFANVDRVHVQAGNPLLETQSGRLEIAKMLLSARLADGSPMLKTPEELVNLVTAGTVEPLLEGEIQELGLIRSENEWMKEGKPLDALITDNQSLHVREHLVLLNSPETRQNQELSANVLGHVMEHIDFWQSPGYQLLARNLGHMPLQGLMPGGLPGDPSSVQDPSQGPQAMPAERAEASPEGENPQGARMPRPKKAEPVSQAA